jgi:hypothetical protein
VGWVAVTCCVAPTSMWVHCMKPVDFGGPSWSQTSRAQSRSPDCAIGSRAHFSSALSSLAAHFPTLFRWLAGERWNVQLVRTSPLYHGTTAPSRGGGGGWSRCAAPFGRAVFVNYWCSSRPAASAAPAPSLDVAMAADTTNEL